VKKFTFLTLLYVALDALSDDLDDYLAAAHIDTKRMQEKLEKIIFMLDKIDLSPVEFFGMLTQMMKTM
jgi:hypothetical protein